MAETTNELIAFGLMAVKKSGYNNLTMIQVVDKLLLSDTNIDPTITKSKLLALQGILKTVPHDVVGMGRVAAYTLISILTTGAVALRIFSRLYRHQFLRCEDWMALVSLFFCLMTATCFILFATLGHDGTHVWDLKFVDVKPWVRTLIAAEFLFKFTNIPVKSTFLVFYYGLSPNKTFRRCVTALLVFTILTVVYALLATVLQCRPVNFWEDVVEAKCMDRFAMYTVCGTFSILTDILILVLPLPVVWKLQLRRKEKVVLTMIFALGGFICIVAVVRLVTLGHWLNTADMTYGNLTFVWTLVELDLGLIIACVPALRALFMPPRSMKASQVSSGPSGRVGSFPLKKSASNLSAESGSQTSRPPDANVSPSQTYMQEGRITKTVTVSLEMDEKDVEDSAAAGAGHEKWALS